MIALMHQNDVCEGFSNDNPTMKARYNTVLQWLDASAVLFDAKQAVPYLGNFPRVQEARHNYDAAGDS